MKLSESSKIRIIKICIILLIISISLLIIQYLQIRNLKSHNTEINNQIEQQQLKSNIIRSSSTTSNKEGLLNYAKNHQVDVDTISKDIAAIDANLILINRTTTTSSTITNKKNNLNYSISEKIGDIIVPIGNVDLSNTIPSFNLNNREYSTTTIISKANDKYVSHTSLQIKTDYKVYNIPILKSETISIKPTAKFSFNPSFYLFASGGINLSPKPFASGGVSGSILEYSSSYQILSIGQVGLAYTTSNRPAISLIPISINLHKVIPVLKNTFIGPTVQYDFKEFGIGLSIQSRL